MRDCHNNGAFLIDTCDRTHTNNPVFTVRAGEVVILKMCSDSPVVLPVEQAVGPLTEASWCTFTSAGSALELSTDVDAVITVSVPGVYRLNMAGVAPGVCVKVETEPLTCADAACVPTHYGDTASAGTGGSAVPATTNFIHTATGQPVYQLLTNGVVTGYYYLDPITGDQTMTNSANWTPESESAGTPQLGNDEATKFETDLTTGEVKELREIALFTDGVKTSTDYNAVDANGIPIVASYTPVAPVADLPVRVELVGETLAATLDTVLAAIPTFATYAEIYVEDTSIRWTKDGSTPADNNGEQELSGTTIRLLDRDEIDGFIATTIDGAGAIDGVAVSNLTVNYWNIAPDED